MKRITLLGLGAKSLAALRAIPVELRGAIAEVIVGRDTNVLDDYSETIRAFCIQNGISCSERSERKPPSGEVIVAIGWRWIVNAAPGQQLVVFHDSLLPKYRGFNPLVTALVNGDTLIGVTALHGAAEYDEGPIISQRRISVTYPLKISRAIDMISTCYAELFVWLIRECAADRLIAGKPQVEADATYSLWRDHEDYTINWNQPANRIKRMIDAVGYPYQGARSTVDSTVIIIDDAEEIEDRVVANRTPGKVLLKRNGCPVVVCSPGLLMLTRTRTETGEPFDTGSRLRIRFK